MAALLKKKIQKKLYSAKWVNKGCIVFKGCSMNGAKVL